MTGDYATAMPLLFVYGTLMSHAGNEMAGTLARHASKLADGTFRGKMYRVHHPDGTWDYPAVIATDDSLDVVHGEIYQLSSPDIFALLDDYEACGPNTPEPHEYTRLVVEVKTAEGECIKAHIYLYALSTAGLEEITSGRFGPPGEAEEW